MNRLSATGGSNKLANLRCNGFSCGNGLMVTDYQCTHCDHRVSMGAYHYHDYSEGYSGRELLLCGGCGTPYAIEFALPGPHREVRSAKYDVVLSECTQAQQVFLLQLLQRLADKSEREAEQLLSRLPQPLFQNLSEHSATEIHQLLTKKQISVEMVLAVPEEISEPELKRDQFLQGNSVGGWCPVTLPETLYTEQKLNQSELHCTACGPTHKLLSFWVASKGCPSCKQGTLRVADEWLT